jgi:lysine-specific demethylase 8
MSPEIQSVTLEQWQEIGARAHKELTPVLLPGLGREFLGESWTPEFFAALYPDIKVTPAITLPKGGVPFTSLAQPHYREMEMREFLEILATGTPCYLSQAALHRFPGLLRHLRPSALKLSSVKAVNLWIGGTTRSGLHFDFGDNMFAQIYGRKRVVLIAPKFTRFLYQFPDVPSKSRVDPENPDLKRFPKFAKCEVIRCQLEPGDLLFIPRGWWHFVAADGISISVNCWHGSSLTWLDFTRLYLAGGPNVAYRCVRDFVWYGLLGRKYERRLFSPLSFGVEVYDRLRSFLTGRDSGSRKMVVR